MGISCRAAGLLTPFEAYTTDIVGQIKTNPVTIEAWTFTNTITGVSTNLVLNFSATYYPAASNGYFAGELAPGNYRLTVDGLSRGALFGIPSSTETQNLAQLATGIPIYAFMNWTLAQFTDVGTAAYSNTSAFFLSALAGTAAYSNAAAFVTPTQWTNLFRPYAGQISNLFNGSFTGDAQSLTNLQPTAFTSGTNAISETATLLSNHVNRTQSQTISGNKTFTGTLLVSNETGIFHIGTIFATNLNGIIGAISNGVWWSGKAHALDMTNSRNFGTAFRSPGSGTQSEQFGLGATASGDTALALGWGATASGVSGSIAIGGAAVSSGDLDIAVGSQASASGTNSTALGNNTTATGQAAAAVGNEATAGGIGATALGVQAVANADYSLALGSTATVDASHTNSMAIGHAATTTEKNQIMLGTSTISVRINNNGTVGGGFAVSGYTTNINAIGTNSFSDISFRRYAITSVAAGNNTLNVGTNTLVVLSGPGAAFNINSITGSPNRNGHFLKLVYFGNYIGTFMHESGFDGTAANRIRTPQTADVAASTTNFVAELYYDTTASRWTLCNLYP